MSNGFVRFTFSSEKKGGEKAMFARLVFVMRFECRSISV